MATNKIKDTTRLTHSGFLRFINELLSTVSDKDKEETIYVYKAIEKDSAKYERLLEECRNCPQFGSIEELEAKRYSLFDDIMDIVEENLYVHINDKNGAFLFIDIEPGKAALEIPSFKASYELMQVEPENEDVTDFFFANEHHWLPSEMDETIDHIIRREQHERCIEAGIISHIPELQLVEESLRELIPYLENAEAITELRELRYDICSLLTISGLEEFNSELNEPRVIDASYLFESRLAEREERRRLEMFSFDELTLTTLATLAENWAKEVTLSSKNENFKANIQKRLSEYLQILGLFRSHYLFEQFEREENSFYREVLRVMDRVVCAIPCYNAEDEECWNRHISTEKYKAARTLLEMLDRTPYDNYCSWEPDFPLPSDVLYTIIEKWNTVENRELLHRVGALELYENLRKLEENAAHSAMVIQLTNKHAKLEKLRHSRFGISIILSILTKEKEMFQT